MCCFTNRFREALAHPIVSKGVPYRLQRENSSTVMGYLEDTALARWSKGMSPTRKHEYYFVLTEATEKECHICDMTVRMRDRNPLV